MKEELKNKLTEEEARELLSCEIQYGTIKAYYSKAIQEGYLESWKQAGIIQQNAKEEFETYYNTLNNDRTKFNVLNWGTFSALFELGFKAISEASSKPISEEVKKARKETDEYIRKYCNYNNIHILKQFLQAERETK
jgi:hypothetical protein